MFAVIKSGGKQYKVAKEDVIRVEKIDAGINFFDANYVFFGDFILLAAAFNYCEHLNDLFRTELPVKMGSYKTPGQKGSAKRGRTILTGKTKSTVLEALR